MQSGRFINELQDVARPGDSIDRQISDEFGEIQVFCSLLPGGEAAFFSSVGKTRGTRGCESISTNEFREQKRIPAEAAPSASHRRLRPAHVRSHERFLRRQKATG